MSRMSKHEIDEQLKILNDDLAFLGKNVLNGLELRLSQRNWVHAIDLARHGKSGVIRTIASGSIDEVLTEASMYVLANYRQEIRNV